MSGAPSNFKFRLDPVLAQRERVEHERAAVHGRALKEQLAAERSRDHLLANRDELRERLVQEHADFDAETLRATYTHLDYLDRAIVAAGQRVDACRAATDCARTALIGAAKDRKVLDTLKERRKEAFELESALADQRELDDQNARVFERAHPFEGRSP